MENEDAVPSDRFEAAIYSYGLSYSEAMFSDDPHDVLRIDSPRFADLVRQGMQYTYPDGVPLTEAIHIWVFFTQVEQVLKEVTA